MAITDYKITNSEVAKVNIESQPDTLTGTATENKQVFDSYPDLIKDRLNTVIDYLDGDYATDGFAIDDSVIAYYRNSLGMDI